MATDGKQPMPERVQTDESLRTERERTDHALAERQRTSEEEADEVIERARADADAVLVTARDKADEQLAATTVPSEQHAAVVEERILEDEVLQDERDLADEQLRRERDETARALALLLPLERDKTDRFLWTERARSDAVVAHRDDFLSIVSHDLRNLLSGIVLSVESFAAAAAEGPAGAPTRAEASRIQRYAARMNRLIGDLIDVASIDAGKLAVTRTQGELGTLIVEAVDTFKTAAVAKGVTLVDETVERGLLADFDHDRLLQVLANLITNAIKFTPRGGAIVVRGEREGDELRLSVRDTGTGIPAAMLEAVFERFWQVGKDDRRGQGLGLYISRCIVAAHGGRIWAESSPGAGSQLSVTIPAPHPV